MKIVHMEKIERDVMLITLGELRNKAVWLLILCENLHSMQGIAIIITSTDYQAWTV